MTESPLFEETKLAAAATELVKVVYNIDGSVGDQYAGPLIETYVHILDSAIPILKKHDLV